MVENGHSVIIVEHNLDMIKCADYIIDLGPNAGINGGKGCSNRYTRRDYKIKAITHWQIFKGKISLNY